MKPEIDIAELVKGARKPGRLDPKAKRRVLAESRVRRIDEARNIRKLRKVVRQFSREVIAEIEPILKRTREEWFIVDEFDDEIMAAFDRIRDESLVLAEQRSEQVAREMVSGVNEAQRSSFYGNIADTFGIDLSSILREEKLEQIIRVKTAENVNLIKSISSEHFEKVQTLVYEGLVQGRDSPNSLVQEMRKLGAKTDRRARFIVRDQTAKLNAAITQARSQNVGIVEYVWRTSGDERVRKTHKTKNRRVFRWDSPPKGTGHPGTDYNCRCSSFSVIPGLD